MTTARPMAQARAATRGMDVFDIVTTAAVPPRPTIAPSERSKSFMTRTTVRPNAGMASGAICRSIVMALSRVGNNSGRRTENRAMVAARAMSTPLRRITVSAPGAGPVRAGFGSGSATAVAVCGCCSLRTSVMAVLCCSVRRFWGVAVKRRTGPSTSR